MHFQEALSKHEFYELCRQKSYDIACTYKNIVFIRHVITFTLHTNLFIPRKRKSIAVNNRWLTDSSVVSEKLKVKEEIKILEDYCYDLRQSRMDSRWSHLTTLERCNVSSLAWYLPKPGSVAGRKDQKGEKRRKYNSKNWRGKRAEWWTLSPPQTTALASLADFFFLPPQELLNLRADDN